ncbi:hypothetical protein [Bifidobacterium pullorum]|uniref:hypothetical protein n=1 Tax=Bifidobacterium pullorum TaxID=78448 RepID=UPI00126A3221|nr:hypothetical protein [Bifidobacterium pullorum]
MSGTTAEEGKPVAASGTGRSTGRSAESDMEAMVVRLDDGGLLLVDTRSGSPFVPTAVDEANIIGVDGRALTADDLRPGNVVRVAGNGIMLESYPGQYPGIETIEVVSEGTAADAERYADLVAELSVTVDPAQPAAANLEYATDLARVTVALRDNGYTWTYEENGEPVQVIADAADPVQTDPANVPDAGIDQPVEGTVVFDRPVEALTVTRWSEQTLEQAASAAGSYQDIDVDSLPAETVTVSLEDEKARVDLDPGYRYALDATFAEGTVGYVFTTLR